MVLKGLRAQGRKADAMLEALGVVLTQGGEPTFIPQDHAAPEWNLEALGEEKLRLAWKLCRELRNTLMPGALILRSNGKQYPGEPIPRWKLMLLNRDGGAPLWTDESLLLNGESPDRAKGKPLSPRTFLTTLAAELGVTGGVRPAYEDVEAAMRQELLCGRPAPLPRYSRLRKKFVQPRWTAEDRKKWQVMHSAAGWVLPLDRAEGRWITADWRLPDGGDLLLLLGTSTIGLRLPLQSLLPETLSCAMTAEIRDGALTLFLPPLPDAAAFQDLIASIEKTVADLGSAPLSIEGYPPPEEEGWESLSVIPDPGVIEVNLPPAADWETFEKPSFMRRRTSGSVAREPCPPAMSCRREEAPTLSWAGPRSGTIPSCSSRGFCQVSCASSSTTPRSPISSAGASWDLPRRRRASTRASLRFPTSWRSRSVPSSPWSRPPILR